MGNRYESFKNHLGIWLPFIVFAGGLYACAIGAAIGTKQTRLREQAEKEKAKPNQIYHAMLNDDEKQDIIVTNGKGERYIFLSQPDGTYKRLEDIQKELGKNQEESSVRFMETIETRVENAMGLDE